VTAEGAERYARESLGLLDEVRQMLRNPRDIVAAVKGLTEEKHGLEKKVEALQNEQANRIKDTLAGKAVQREGYTEIIEKISAPTADAVKNIAYALRNQFDDLLLVLAADVDGKPLLTVMIGEKLMESNRFHAGNMVKELAREIQGGGGGQAFYATAGGKNLAGLSIALEKARKLISAAL